MSQDRVILQNTGHPDHLMINQDHLTSPLTSLLTNHPMSHLTSPLTGHLTSPFTGHPMSHLTNHLMSHLTNHPMSHLMRHLTNHPMSHLTGHPTSLDPLTDHIERKNFSFHLPVVSGMLMVAVFHL